MSIEPGTILDGRYRVLSMLGKGGMGAVFLAENTRVGRQVAIKVLHKELASSPEVLQRFENEAQAAAQIGSDRIVQVYDFGTTDDGDRFMVMELLEGDTLKQRLRKARTLTVEQAAPMFAALLDGLAAAHAAGIVHRDLKPDNVFLQRENAGQRDWLKILDFGISKFSALVGDDGGMTKAGVVMGTPFFMSPEQAKSANLADNRSDLYSVGAMLFQVLTGDVPFRASTLTEMLFKVVFEPLPHPRERNPALSDEMSMVILKGMAKEPHERFQSAQEFKAALLAAAAGPSLGAPRAPALTAPLGGMQMNTIALPSESHPGLGGLPAGSYPGVAGVSQPGVFGASHPGFGQGSQPGFQAPGNPSISGLGLPPHSAPAMSDQSSPSIGTQGAWDAQVQPPTKTGVPAWLMGAAALSVVGLIATGVLLLGGGSGDKKKAAAATTSEPAKGDGAKAPEAKAPEPKAAKAPEPSVAEGKAPEGKPASPAETVKPAEPKVAVAAQPAKVAAQPPPPKAATAPPPQKTAAPKVGPKVVEGIGY